MEVVYHIRRATLDDLPALKALWEVARQPGIELEKRLTQFQLVERPDGVLSGAFGFRASGLQGLLFGAAFHSPPQAIECRQVVWERIETLCRTQGVARLWLRGEPGETWRDCGFRPSRTDELKRLPPDFAAAGRGVWWTHVLRDEAVIEEALKREFGGHQATQLAQTERVQRSAAALKWVAMLIALVLFAAAMAVLFVVSGRGRRRP